MVNHVESVRITGSVFGSCGLIRNETIQDEVGVACVMMHDIIVILSRLAIPDLGHPNFNNFIDAMLLAFQVS